MTNNAFSTFINKIFHIGIYEDTPEDDKGVIVLFNQLSYTIASIFVITFFQDLFVLDIRGMLMDIITILVCLNGPILNYFRLHKVAKMLFMLVHPLLLAIVIVIYSDMMHSSYIFILSFTCALILFENRKTIISLVLYITALWFGADFYCSNYPPLITYNPSFLDTSTAPVMTLLGIYLIISTYKKNVRSKEKTLKATLTSEQNQNEKLNIANTELERFAFATSHDLKTPVRAIVSFLNLIEIKIQKQEYSDLKEYIGHAKEGGIRINRMISEILEFSKLNIGQVLTRSEVDLNEIFAKNIVNLEGILLEKNGKFEVATLGKINSNELLLELLFQNLLENGLKFNKNEKPYVKVFSKKEEKGISIFFEDNGIGIEEEFHETIFHVFTKLHNQQDYVGTGMGLAICKKIMERLGGSISFTSEKNIGTTFVLFFPK